MAGSTLLGVSYGELRDVTLGWSAAKILGHPVYNNTDERADRSTTSSSRPALRSPTQSSMPAASLRWLSTTSPFRFLFQLNGDKLVLPGATRDALKAALEFEYANQPGGDFWRLFALPHSPPESKPMSCESADNAVVFSTPKPI